MPMQSCQQVQTSYLVENFWYSDVFTSYACQRGVGSQANLHKYQVCNPMILPYSTAAQTVTTMSTPLQLPMMVYVKKPAPSRNILAAMFLDDN